MSHDVTVETLHRGRVAVARPRRAHLNSSLGSLKLLLQGLMSGQQGAAPPLLLG